ncbi:MAG: acyltransferase [Erythrobacter sp.]
MEDGLFDVRCDFFDEQVQSAVRRQIFFQVATAGMSDGERARFAGLPQGCRMREGAKIIAPQNLRIGKNVWIGENAVLDASGGLEIGSNTSIGLGVFVWTHDSHKLNRMGNNTSAAASFIRRKPTKIGERCFIAGPSVIMPGVTLGPGSVVAPMSVIFHDTAPESTNTPYRDMLALERRIAELEKKVNQTSER